MSTSFDCCFLRKTLGSLRECCGNERDPARVFHVAVADTLDQAPVEPWDALSRTASFFLSRSYLRAIESAGPDNIRHRYAIVLRGGEPAAIVAAQVIDLSGLQLVSAEQAVSDAQTPAGLFPRLKQHVRDTAARCLGGRIVACGNFFSTGRHGVAFAPHEDPLRVWPAVVEALSDIGRRERARYLLIKDVPGEDTGLGRQLRRLGFSPLDAGPNMVLSIPSHWRSHDDYVHALKAKYRKAARAVFEEVEQASFTVERLEDLTQHAQRLHALYLNVERKAEVSFAAFSPEYLPALAHAADGDRFRCTVIRRGEDILGFMTTLRDGETACAHYVGMDYAANARVPIYFRLLHAAIADAIEWRCRELSFGCTAAEPKARLGARPVPMASWVRHRCSAANVAVRVLTPMLSSSAPPQRHPFRDE